ncbi:FAS1 domain-containing protein [Quillaja saponaria]|uniref:FAS1 domain-containing protein n=1 Tax=Quillaja saponaria TaxID=32244 RepID=A0AAD7PUK6_QUISA|nr:FAS1 domain-containing protein [Quillaja saponaria]
MGLYFLFILLFLFRVTESQSTAHTFNHTDLQAAIVDMRSKAYYGFTILLQMLNETSLANSDLTFFMPNDRKLSESSISANHLGDFLLSHSIPMPLHFSDLAHFPTGTVVPSDFSDRMIRIHNGGRGDFFVNNAQVTERNICVNSVIKCHGIDAVIEYDNVSYS